MRVLLLLRGAAGCGKSTWIERNGLKSFTLCPDDIRLLCQSPQFNKNGKEEISQNNESTVWRIVFQLLETRMKHGEFTVIDATNSKTADMKKYKALCENYRYRIYCVDFTDIPIEETKKRNLQRTAWKQVPEAVIDKMYFRFKTQKIPSGITVLKPDEIDKIWYKKRDFSEYKAIHHIGDIHGCYTALKEYFAMSGGIKDDELYIFTGDYIDRGIENSETVKFLLEIFQKPNVILLEGNHEIRLWNWSNNKAGKSKEFELITKVQLETAGVRKKDVRQLYRKLNQSVYYLYHDKSVLVEHAGISTLAENLTFISTEQFIWGTGSYNDIEEAENTFDLLTDENTYQIHGHRNPKGVPVKVNDSVFNLEGRVESGGHLRVVKLDANGFHCYEIKNEVFKKPEMISHQQTTLSSVGDLIIQLRSNKYIDEKKFGNISSFNFSQAAFYGKLWDEQTIRARGLYIDTVKRRIVARSYDKFFNINGRPETMLDLLQYKLQFPVEAYVKENGFLGIVSYNEYTDDLFVTTKSNPNGDFAQWLREILIEKYPDSITKIKEFCKEHDVSLLFECVDMKRDPHIIEYPENRLILLDIVKNDMEYSKYNFEDMCQIADELGIEHKKRAYEIANWQEFLQWYYEVTESEYEFESKVIEGFVIEDSVGYMVKVKLAYYNFWKSMRNVANETMRNGCLHKTGGLTTPLAREFYEWVRMLRDNPEVENTPRDICTLRRWFYESQGA